MFETKVNLQKHRADSVGDLRCALRVIAIELRRWATQSQTGGWSTHQVEANNQLAGEIEALVGRSGH